MTVMSAEESDNRKISIENLERIFDSRRNRIASIVFLLSIGLIFHFLVLMKVPHMSYGIDGPYYDLQVISILETGFPYQFDPPFVFYYQTLWVLILGDITIGIKVGMIILAALVAPSALLFFKEISGSFAVSWIAGFLLIFDPMMLSLDNGFYKNLAGIPLMFLFFFFYVRATRDGSKKDLILAFVFLCVTFLTHIFPAGLILIGVGVHWLYNIHSERNLWMSTTKIVVQLGVGLLAILLIVFVIYPDALSKFSKIINLTTDVTNIDILGIEDIDWIDFLIGPESRGLILIAGMSVVGFGLRRKHLPQESIIIFGIGISEILLCSPLIPFDWRWRFAMLVFIPMVFGLSYFFLTMKPLCKPRRRSISILIIIVLICSIQIVGGIHISQRVRPVIPPIAYDDLVNIAENQIIPDDGIVAVLTRGLLYWIPLTQKFEFINSVPDAIELARSKGMSLYILADPSTSTLPSFTTCIYSGSFFSVYVGIPPS